MVVFMLNSNEVTGEMQNKIFREIGSGKSTVSDEPKM